MSVHAKSTNNTNDALLPVVILVHGARQSMRTVFFLGRGARRWLDVCDEPPNGQGFVLLIPNGVNPKNGDTKGNNQVWNDYNNFGTESVDDVGFLSALTQWAVNIRGGVDTRRVYLTGLSNGGMMAYRALIETESNHMRNSTTIPYAAAAAFIANMPAANVTRNNGTANVATPILIMNGNQDKIVKWNGGTDDFGPVRSALATRDFWIQFNRAEKDGVQRSDLPNRRRFDGCRVESEFYPATMSVENTPNSTSVMNDTFFMTTASAPVQFYTMNGGGHMMPYTRWGWYPWLLRLRNGPACRDVNAADLAWDFLSQYAR